MARSRHGSTTSTNVYIPKQSTSGNNSLNNSHNNIYLSNSQNLSLTWENALQDIIPVLKLHYKADNGISEFLKNSEKLHQLKFSSLARTEYNRRCQKERSVSNSVSEVHEVYAPPRARRVAKEVAVDYIRRFIDEQNDSLEASTHIANATLDQDQTLANTSINTAATSHFGENSEQEFTEGRDKSQSTLQERLEANIVKIASQAAESVVSSEKEAQNDPESRDQTIREILNSSQEDPDAEVFERDNVPMSSTLNKIQEEEGANEIENENSESSSSSSSSSSTSSSNSSSKSSSKTSKITQIESTNNTQLEQHIADITHQPLPLKPVRVSTIVKRQNSRRKEEQKATEAKIPVIPVTGNPSLSVMSNHMRNLSFNQDQSPDINQSQITFPIKTTSNFSSHAPYHQSKNPQMVKKVQRTTVQRRMKGQLSKTFGFVSDKKYKEVTLDLDNPNLLNDSEQIRREFYDSSDDDDSGTEDGNNLGNSNGSKKSISKPFSVQKKGHEKIVVDKQTKIQKSSFKKEIDEGTASLDELAESANRLALTMMVKKSNKGKKHTVFVDPAPLVRKIQTITAERDHAHNQISQANIANQNLHDTNINLNSEKQQLSDEKQLLESTLEATNIELNNTKNELQSEKLLRENLENEIEKININLSNTSKEVVELKTEVSGLEKDLEFHKAENNSLRKECKGAWNISAQRKDEIGILKSALEAARSASARANQTVNEAQKQNNDLSVKNRRLAEKNLDLKGEVSMLKAREEEIKTLVQIQKSIFTKERTSVFQDRQLRVASQIGSSYNPTVSASTSLTVPSSQSTISYRSNTQQQPADRPRTAERTHSNRSYNADLSPPPIPEETEPSETATNSASEQSYLSDASNSSESTTELLRNVREDLRRVGLRPTLRSTESENRDQRVADMLC